MELNGGAELDRGYGGGVTTNEESDRFLDDLFNDNSFAEKENINRLFDDTDFAEVGLVSVEEEPVPFEVFGDDFDEEDERLLTEAERRGYEVSQLHYLASDALQALIGRIPDNPEKEIMQVRELLAQEAENFKELLGNLQASMATNLSFGEKGESSLIYARMSADTSLSHETSARISDIIYDIVNTSPEIIEEMENPEEELTERIVGMLLEHTELQQKRDEVGRFIAAILPIMQKQKNITQERMKAAYDNRMKISKTLLMNKYKNILDAISVAQDVKGTDSPSLRYFRYISWDGSNFVTKCPQCGKQIAIRSPAMQCFAYRDNNGSSIHFFRGYESCKECNTRLTFTDREFLAIKRWFRSTNNERLASFTLEAISGSPGASVVYVDVPMKQAATLLPEIMQQDYAGSADQHAQEENISAYVQVNDEEIKEAAREFYFKLRGMPPLQEKYGMAQACANIINWTYHDMAVFIVQMLSNDYYTEKARALFSLISFMNTNPVFRDVLALDILWSLEQGIKKLNMVLDSMHGEGGLSCRGIYDAVVELNGLLTQFSICIDKDNPKEKELVYARDRLCSELMERNHQRDVLLEEFSRLKRQLSYVKMVHISAVKYMELVRYCGDRKSAVLFDEIADLMLINNYATDFYDVWTTHTKLNKQQLSAMFSESAGMHSIRTKLQRLKTEQKLFSEEAFENMRAIYVDTESTARSSRALRRAIESMQVYDICRTITLIDIAKCPEMFDICSKMDAMCQRVIQAADNNVEYCLLAQGFTKDEIKQVETEDLFIGMQMPVRKDGESIIDYVKRIPGDGIETVSLYYGLGWQSKEEAIKCAADMCMVSLPFEFDYDNFEKFVFMSALLQDYCGTVSQDSLERVIGISCMHQNVVKLVENHVADFSSAKELYGLCYAFYETTVNQDLEKLFVAMSDTDCHVSSGIPDPVSLYSLRSLLREVVINSDSRLVDGEVVSNSAEEIVELAERLDMTPSELIAYCNVEG